MTQAGLDVYGRKGLVNRIPLGDAATFARRLRRAIARKKTRFIYPRYYAFARWFPRVARWFSEDEIWPEERVRAAVAPFGEHANLAVHYLLAPAAAAAVRA